MHKNWTNLEHFLGQTLKLILANHQNRRKSFKTLTPGGRLDSSTQSPSSVLEFFLYKSLSLKYITQTLMLKAIFYACGLPSGTYLSYKKLTFAAKWTNFCYLVIEVSFGSWDYEVHRKKLGFFAIFAQRLYLGKAITDLSGTFSRGIRIRPLEHITYNAWEVKNLP